VNLHIRDSENNKAFIDDFSFRPPSLTIYSGTTVEFIMKNNTSIHKLGCENEFSGIDMNHNNRSYKHRFLSVGYYEVQDEVFSFMICRITVIECTKIKSSSPLNDIALTSNNAAVKTNSAANDNTLAVKSTNDTTFVAAADSTVNTTPLVHPIDIIDRDSNAYIITVPPTIDMAIQDTDIPYQKASDTMKCDANHSSVVPSAATAIGSRPCISSNSPHHLLHGSFATDTDPSKKNNSKTNDDVNVDSDESGDVKRKENPAESDYMSTADIDTSPQTTMTSTFPSPAIEVTPTGPLSISELSATDYMSTADIDTSPQTTMTSTFPSPAIEVTPTGPLSISELSATDCMSTADIGTSIIAIYIHMYIYSYDYTCKNMYIN
jgi:hypothetical protein